MTIHRVSTSARFAYPVFAGNEPDANPLTDFPSGYSAAQRFNAAYNFMSRNARQIQTRVGARDRGRIGMTDSAGFHPNANLTCSGLRDRAFHQSEHAWGRDFHCFVCIFRL